MSDTPNPLRPVVFTYGEDTEQDGSTYLAGSTFQAPSPEAVWQAHPKATIVRYVDGGAYSQHGAKEAVRERDTPPAAQDAPPPADTKTEEDAKTETKARK